jgi:N-acetylmuramoyl-L-alanine amidase
MAEPARQKDPYDNSASEQPINRPDLRAREGIGSNTAGGNSGGATSHTSSGSGGASSSIGSGSGGAASDTGKGLYNASGEGSRSLKDAEGSPDDNNDQVGRGYTPGNSNSTGKARARFRITRRRAAVGIGATTLISVAFGFFSISSGPLEFVHIAQLLDKFHFSSQQNAQDGRLMKIARYIKDPAKPQNTRMGIVGNAVAGKLETKVNDSTGLSSDYDTASGRFKGYVVDRNQENFKGKTDEQIKNQLASQYGVDRSSITGSGDSITFNPDTGGLNLYKRYASQTRTARTLLGESGLSKVESYAGSRVLGKRAGWTFHPIKELDAAVQAKALEGGQKAIDKLKEQFRKDEVQYVTTGVEPVDINASNDSAKNPDGTPKDPSASSGANTVSNSANSVNSDVTQTASDLSGGTDSIPQLKDKLSVKATAGGAAGIAGLFCILEGLNAHIQQAKFDKAELPMMRMAGQAISLGSQVQSGQDISALQLGFVKDSLDTKGSNGNVTSTWNQAQSIQAEEGQPQTGPDIPKSGQVFDNAGPLASILNGIPGLGTVCSALASPLGILVSVLTGPISALASFATGPVVDEASGIAAGWLSGAPVNPLASGADYGNYINYGSRLAANEQYGSAGGVQMNSGAEQQLATTGNTLDQADFQSKSIAYRIFNPDDSQTLASHIIDNYGSESATQDMASMARGFGSIFSSALKAPASLLSSVVHAAPAAPYDYHGMKKVGFTASELANPAFDNPFDNACYVSGHCKLSNGHQVNAGILDGPNGSTYIDQADKCFGVKITGDGSSGWTTDSSSTVNFLDNSYPSSTCSSDSDQNWVQVRFWLLDTATIEGYDCYQSDTSTSDQSCTDVGFGAPSSGPTTGSSSKPVIVIDPGHGPNRTVRDPTTGLNMIESDNTPEIQNVWDVANIMKKDLGAAGYNVILTKGDINDNVTFRGRADIADKSNAALALSIHGDPTLPDPGEIFVQKVGLFRGQGSNKTVFTDAGIATKSQDFANIFKQQRESVSGNNVVIKDNSFDGRAPLEPGNISMVQLFSKTPWVYNEKRMPFDNQEYAKELESSVEKSVPLGSH